MSEASYPVVRAIENRLKNSIGAIDPSWTAAANLKWPGQPLTPADNPHVEVNVLFAEPDWLTHGAELGVTLLPGIAQFTFRNRPGTGLGAMRERAAVLRTLFHRKTLAFGTGGEVASTDPDVIEFGPAGAPRQSVADDAWETLIVDCPFTVEETEVVTP